ncbi:uncharacterized protein LOC131649838 [Vicia villosa]|uniref:uncharacterized protein LOC131649838 n=1 Tax=Vicia villosa TaxID=3911 RepID=UPI00273B00D1|nr:uncharacterized protein LOC131649838 [Vicia villosa]
MVNESSTQEFKMERGLREGDCLSPLLFIIAAEGLAGLMKNAISVSAFRPFKLTHDLQFSPLQLADDTLILGDVNWDNILAIKVLLRGFKLVSSLKVNFSKSNIIGVNLEDSFFGFSFNFFSCPIAHIPFIFLGIPIGANQHRKGTCNPILAKLRSKTSLWRGKHVSFGTHLVLINADLNSIPLFFFSFYRAPKIVLHEITNI